MEKVTQIINMLVYEHDEHMKLAYTHFVAGEDVSELWAYGAGLQHAIRSMQDILENNSQ